MKKMKILVTVMLGVTLATVSCKKEEPTEPSTDTTESPSAQALGSFFEGNTNDRVQTFTIDVTNAESITGANGTVINFPNSAFETQSGTVASGNVDIELIEIFAKSDMIRLNKPTMANHPNGGLAPLISGGQFKLTASQNGEDLNLRPGFSYVATVPASEGIDQNMDVFYGNGDSDTVVWNQADSSIIWGEGNEYTAYFDSLNWINLDYFMDEPGQQTTVQVEVPQGFNNQNCAVFISFDGLNSLAMLYNASNNVFTSSYTLPIGLDVHFVVLSFINDEPHVAIVQAQLSDGHYEVIQQLTQTTTGQLDTELSNLP